MKAAVLLLAIFTAAASADPVPAPPPTGDLGRSFVTIPYSELRALWEAGQRKPETTAPPEAAPVPYVVHRAEVRMNAIDFSPSGGVIRIHITADTAGGRAQLTVEDEGSGIPDYALPRLFERFYSLQRPDTGRKSSGLGLCFVREAANLHGGSVEVVNRASAQGAVATLLLPLSIGLTSCDPK